jgi:hypothetical protein
MSTINNLSIKVHNESQKKNNVGYSLHFMLKALHILKLPVVKWFLILIQKFDEFENKAICVNDILIMVI